MVEEHEDFHKDKLQREYNDAYWEQHYTICRDRIPVFLELIADKILRTGKYLNVVSQCGKWIMMKSVLVFPLCLIDLGYFILCSMKLNLFQHFSISATSCNLTAPLYDVNSSTLLSFVYASFPSLIDVGLPFCCSEGPTVVCRLCDMSCSPPFHSLILTMMSLTLVSWHVSMYVLFFVCLIVICLASCICLKGGRG